VELAEDARQHRGHREAGEGHAHAPGLTAGDGGELGGESVEVAQERLDAVEERLPVGVILDLAARAAEEIEPGGTFPTGRSAAESGLATPSASAAARKCRRRATSRK
jgi:hypothetical protein